MLSVAGLFVLSLAIVAIQADVPMHNPFYCYSEDPIRQWTGLGGYHSPYEPNRGQFINANVSTCVPSKFWMTGRHGSRLPSDTELPDLIRVVNAVHRQILTNYDQGRTSLCASDFEVFRNWQFDPNITMDVAYQLTASGWDEMVAIAQRFQTAFPTVLPTTYSTNDYMFQPTMAQRTQDSLYAIADGLFGVNGHEQVRLEDIPEPDIALRPFSHCSNFTALLDRVVRVEQRAFIDGPEFQEMVMQVSARLGFQHSHILRSDEVTLLGLYCKYEQTWNLNAKSPFCAAFSVANAQVLEYMLDLEWFHRIGYGRPEYRRLYENIMCFAIQDMLRFIDSNDVNDHKARIFNGHVSQLLILLHFDAFDGDAILTRHNFAQQTRRAWRSTDIMPMAANLAVIRYDCADGDNDLLFLYNERPLQIPGCDSNGVCKQSLIFERLARYLNANCMEIYCTNS